MKKKPQRKKQKETLRPRWDKYTDAHEIANTIRGRTIKVECLLMPGYREIKVGKIKKITNISPSGKRIRREVHFIDADTGGYRAVNVADIVRVSG